jgi:hypothetical protein
MPTHVALLTDRKPADADAFAFAPAHGCAIADAGANSATAATAPADARTPLNPLPINPVLSRYFSPLLNAS